MKLHSYLFTRIQNFLLNIITYLILIRNLNILLFLKFLKFFIKKNNNFTAFEVYTVHKKSGLGITAKSLYSLIGSKYKKFFTIDELKKKLFFRNKLKEL
jgi:hypothetical protein